MKAIKIILIFLTITLTNNALSMIESIASDKVISGLVNDQIQLVELLYEIDKNRSDKNEKDIYNVVYNKILQPIVDEIFDNPYEEVLLLLQKKNFNFNQAKEIIEKSFYKKVELGEMNQARLLLSLQFKPHHKAFKIKIYSAATNSSNFEAIKFLIKEKDKLKSKFKIIERLTRYSKVTKEEIIFKAINRNYDENSFEIAKLIILSGANINYRNTNDETIIYKIIINNIISEDIVKEKVFEFLRFAVTNGFNSSTAFTGINEKTKVLIQIYYPKYKEEFSNYLSQDEPQEK